MERNQQQENGQQYADVLLTQPQDAGQEQRWQQIPPQYAQYPPQPVKQPGHGAAVASLVLGIIGVALFWFIYVSAILGLIGFCMAIVAKKNGNKEAKTIAGLILSLIALLIGGGLWVYSIITIREAANQINWNSILNEILK
ncbi:MAG: hypothetical protein IK016_08630 [Lachnospiraceae bacterium]|nr:hypothetical protein [Lachnospiraceae bacterium]